MSIRRDRPGGLPAVNRISGMDLSAVGDGELSAAVAEHDRVDHIDHDPVGRNSAIRRRIACHSGVDQIQAHFIPRVNCAAIRPGLVERQCGVDHIHLQRGAPDRRRKGSAGPQGAVFAERVAIQFKSDPGRSSRPRYGHRRRSRRRSHAQLDLLLHDVPAQHIDPDAHEERVESSVGFLRQPDRAAVAGRRIRVEEIAGNFRIDADVIHAVGVAAEEYRPAAVGSGGMAGESRIGQYEILPRTVVLPPGQVHENRAAAACRKGRGIAVEYGVADFHLKITFRVHK